MGQGSGGEELQRGGDMFNLMVANATGGKGSKRLEHMLRAQVHNTLELGWPVDSIFVLTNFPFSFMGVEAHLVHLNEFCLTGSKMFGVRWLMDNYPDMLGSALSGNGGAAVWAHDLDAWQNAPFEEPEFKDVGIAQYSNSKFNGGSVFWRRSASDIVGTICEEIQGKTLQREEPTLNSVLKCNDYKDRVTVINNTFNVGCSGYVVRVQRSDKPLRVCHFHPDNRIAWETHALDRNEIGEIGVTVRLERLIRSYYPDLARKVETKRKLKQTGGK